MHHAPALSLSLLAAATLSAALGAQDALPSIEVKPMRDVTQLPAQSSTRVIVKFEAHVDTAPLAGDLAELLAPLGVRLADRGYAGAFEVLEVPANSQALFIDWLNRQDAVAYAEPDGMAYAFGNPPNDTYFAYQWHLMDHGMTSVNAVSNFGVQAPEAWSTANGSGAVVAVVDTGVAYENFGGFAQAPDLANTSFTPGYDFVNNDTHANDDEGHGTHVTGTIAQSTNNNLGTAGVAYGATIMPVKVLDSSGSGAISWVASGIIYAADNGADVINLSLGGGASTTLQSAVDYAWSQGAVVVAATGNSGASSISYPARYTNAIAVGATDFAGNRSYYSQYGTGIDVTAPGGDVTADLNGDGYGDGVLQQTIGTSVTSFGYYFYQGTSMATPHAAGVAALIKSANPSLNNAQIRSILESTCVDRGAAGYDTTYGYGIVDAAAAVAAAGGGGGDPAPGAPTGLGATAGDGTVSLDWNDNSESDLDGYHVYRSTGGGYTRLTSSPISASAYTDNAVTNGTTYTYVVTAIDNAGQESAQSGSASASPQGSGGGDTTPPATPTGLTGSNSTRGVASLDWSDNSESDLAGYNVYRATSRNGTYSQINGGLVTSSDYVDSNVSRRVRYYYKVTAVDTSGNESGQTGWVSVRVR